MVESGKTGPNVAKSRHGRFDRESLDIKSQKSVKLQSSGKMRIKSGIFFLPPPPPPPPHLLFFTGKVAVHIVRSL